MVVQHLLRHWLQQQAAEKLREKVAEAAKQEFASGEAAEPEERPPVEIGLVFAMGIEAGGIADLLSDSTYVRGPGFKIQQGTLDGRQIAVVTSGVGWEAAAQATTALIQGHQPKWVLSSGFAGGLQPELKQRDIVMANAVLDTDGNRLTIDLKVDPESLKDTPGVHIGSLLTVDRIIRLPEEKQELGAQHHAMAVDMETFAVAEVCRHYHTPCLAVRTIIDAMADRLPEDLERLVNEKDTVRKLGAAVGTIWRRPGSVKDLYKLKEDALGATDHLAKFLRSMIGQLPK